MGRWPETVSCDTDSRHSGDRDRERMSSDRGDRSEDEDQRQTYYAISSYTAVEDSQVASYMGFQILHFVCIDNI